MTDDLRQAAEEAVREIYTEEGAEIWWADHDRQTPEERERRQQKIVALVDGAYL